MLVTDYLLTFKGLHFCTDQVCYLFTMSVTESSVFDRFMECYDYRSTELQTSLLMINILFVIIVPKPVVLILTVIQ